MHGTCDDPDGPACKSTARRYLRCPAMVSPLLLAPLLGGAAWSLDQALGRREQRRYPPPNRRAELGGNPMHYGLRGDWEREGPALVLDARSGEWSTHFGRTAERLGALAPVLTYDRPGLGWSPHDPTPAGPDDASVRLHRLLGAVAPDRPVILVADGDAHHRALQFARRYPHEVVGLLLLDPGAAGVPPASRTRRGLARLGWLRWLQPHAAFPSDLEPHVTAHEARLIATLGRRLGVLHAAALESQAVEEPSRSAPEVPAVVVSGTPVPAEVRELLPPGTQVESLECGARAHLAAPEAVLRAAELLLARARA